MGKSGRWRGRRFSGEEWLLMYRRVLGGCSYSGIAAELDGSRDASYRVFGAQRQRLAGGRRSPLRLSLVEREEISRALTEGVSLREMGRRLGRAALTVAREVSAYGGRKRYRAWRGDECALQRTRRRRMPKLAGNAALSREVERLLAELWSPQRISAHLKVTYPGDEGMRVSREAIYQALFVQGRGSLRKELTRCLRTSRAHRRPQGRSKSSGLLTGMIMISERPAEVEDRAVPGHWES